MFNTPEKRAAEIQRIIDEIYMSQGKPNWKPRTSEQMRTRARNLQGMATQIKVMGGKVKPEYEYIDRAEI